jgi:triosephosphate isomerase
MNAGGQEAFGLATGVADGARGKDRVEVVIAPPFTALAAVAYELHDQKSGVQVGAQNMHHEPGGAFTGEISAPMLKDSGAAWVILGHSERRQHFGETDEIVARKVTAAIRAELKPIACVGETLEEREGQRTLEVVERQVRALLDELAKKPGFGVIAYEPVWAIGTGKVARPEDAQEVHALIRRLLSESSPELAEATRILYGGSVKADNAEGLLSQADIDGALVGGASLDAAGFSKIVETAERLADAAERG